MGALTPASVFNICAHVQAVLTPDLLDPSWRKLDDSEHPRGYSYCAAEAAFHLLGARGARLRACYSRTELGENHWWVEREDGEIIDPTDHAYTPADLEIIYAGRNSGFFKKRPTRRASLIFLRIAKASLATWDEFDMDHA